MDIVCYSKWFDFVRMEDFTEGCSEWFDFVRGADLNDSCSELFDFVWGADLTDGCGEWFDFVRGFDLSVLAFDLQKCDLNFCQCHCHTLHVVSNGKTNTSILYGYKISLSFTGLR